jgi:hypothetical protein
MAAAASVKSNTTLLPNDLRLSPRCILAPPSRGSSPLAPSPGGGSSGGAESSFSASSRGHSPFGKSSHSRQSSLVSSSSNNSSFLHNSFSRLDHAHSMSHAPPPPRHLRQSSDHELKPMQIPERHFRQSSEPVHMHSRQSSSTTSGDSSLGREAVVGGARRKVPRPPPPLPNCNAAAANFVLGGNAKMSSSTTSIDMGYHTMLNNGENSSLEPWDTSIDSINLTCPPVTYFYALT